MRTVNGEETLRARGALSTEPVLQSPRAAPSRQWLGESTEGQDALRVCSYNVLAEIYATAHAYPYCPRWALDGGYRCSLVVQELVDADADVVCLQEAQRDAFESYLEPAMKRAGPRRRPIFFIRHLSASSAREEAVGGFFFDLEPVRTAYDRVTPRRLRGPLHPKK